MRPRYRRLIDPAEALALLLERAGPPGSAAAEWLATEEACGRVTAAPVRAAHSSPPYHAAAMDGIAVRSSDTTGASPTTPRTLTAKQATPIDTGDPLPASADAVIPIEFIQPLVEGEFEIQAAAAPRQHVRLSGEDVVAGEIVLPGNRLIGPAHLGAILGAGVTRVQVHSRPRVAVLPTGDELCEPGEDPRAGRVVESNSRMLAAAVRSWGGDPVRLKPVPDDPEILRQVVERAAAEHRLVLVLSGSSAGRGDFTAQALGATGEVLFQGVAWMPGKPALGAVARSGAVIIGVPGFPVSAMVVADRLVRPLLAHWLGVAPSVPERLQAWLLRPVPSRPGLEEIVRVMLGHVSGRWVAAPLARGAGGITTLTRAHGLLRIPGSSEGILAGQPVEIELLARRFEIEQGLLFAGSHDLLLECLDDALGSRFPGSSLSVTPLGSLGGLSALARGEVHLAGCHLLDPDGSDFNRTAVAQTLPGREILLVTLAFREQGLCMRHGEAPVVTSLREATAAGLRFVNRQPGSGTRLLTDTLLAREKLSPAELPGYAHEEFTHLAVAEAVRTHAGDCGIAVRAAAAAAGLHFVPLAEERYELVIPRENLSDARIRRLLSVLESRDFAQVCSQLPGYDGRETGRRRALPDGKWDPDRV